MKKRNHLTSVILTLILVLPIAAWANHVVVENISLTDQNAASDYTHIEFDISWDNSWRVSEISGDGTPTWDAAWVFAKWKLNSGSTWAHCTLSTTDLDHTAPTGSTIDATAVGVFIYRSGDGSGSNNWDNARIRWEYGEDVADDDVVDVKVFAIEMVNIPQGAFALHTDDDATLTANFQKADGTIDSEDETEVELGTITWDRSESLWCGSQDNAGNTGGSADLCGGYPKGFGAIYCMKYEISQGQYADFLNTLTSTQDGNRFPNQNGNYRHTITGSAGSRTTTTSNRACNYLQWADGLAYADWAGLRPMTELEYEKICRGPESADTDYAWGSTSITQCTDPAGAGGTDGNADAHPNGNACYDSGFGSGITRGPVRCGGFASTATSRETSGASYYGVMELSGNLWERCITIAMYCWNGANWDNATGAGSFDGGHGDGSLTTDGYANVTNWPSPAVTTGYTALGSSFRGGSWSASTTYLRGSDRHFAADPHANRSYNYGFRLSRTITP